MSRPHKFIENLSTESRETLEYHYKYSDSSDFRHRCHGILLSAQGYRVDEIAKILKYSPQTVYHWFNKWQTSGLAGLLRKPGQGRKCKLRLDDPEHCSVLQTAIKNHGQSSSQMLDEIQQTLGIEDLSQKTLKRFLKKVVTDGSDIEKL